MDDCYTDVCITFPLPSSASFLTEESSKTVRMRTLLGKIQRWTKAENPSIPSHGSRSRPPRDYVQCGQLSNGMEGIKPRRKHHSCSCCTSKFSTPAHDQSLCFDSVAFTSCEIRSFGTPLGSGRRGGSLVTKEHIRVKCFISPKETEEILLRVAASWQPTLNQTQQ